MRVEIAEHPDLPETLQVNVQGAETFDNTVAVWRRIVEAVSTHGSVRRLLLMDGLRGEELEESQWLELVLAFKGQGLDTMRIAHVRVWGLREVEYCELYARDAGVDARVFGDEASATEWLRQG